MSSPKPCSHPMKACIIESSCCTNKKKDNICTHPYSEKDFDDLLICVCKFDRCINKKKKENYEAYITRLFKNNVVRYSISKHDGQSFWTIIGCGIGKIKERDLIQDKEYSSLYQSPPSIKEMCNAEKYIEVRLLSDIDSIPQSEDDIEPIPQSEDDIEPIRQNKNDIKPITKEILFKIITDNYDNKELFMVFAKASGEPTDELIDFIKSHPNI